jgi:hypothetical protein
MDKHVKNVHCNDMDNLLAEEEKNDTDTQEPM